MCISFVCVCLSLSLCVYVCVCMCLSLCVSLSVCVSFSLSLSVCVWVYWVGRRAWMSMIFLSIWIINWTELTNLFSSFLFLSFPFLSFLFFSSLSLSLCLSHRSPSPYRGQVGRCYPFWMDFSECVQGATDLKTYVTHILYSIFYILYSIFYAHNT